MSVTAPGGFRAAGTAAGIRSRGALDVALVVNEGPEDAAAGVFTTNRFAAPPVRWSRHVLADGRLRAVVLNSGVANACTGAAGVADTAAAVEHTAAELGLEADTVAAASTGRMGVRLPMGKLTAGITTAVKELSGEGGPDAARAILTTDRVPKTTVQHRAGWSVGGMVKGGGMLSPSLATMIAVLTTDAVVPPELLDRALRRAGAVTFERVDSDGCRSTNDTVIVMASGASRVTPEPEDLTAALTAACADLAGQLLGDAEGSTKDVAITVRNAASLEDALSAGRACAGNVLVKTALYGNDPNWGRVLAAIGASDADFDPDRVDVTINGVTVCRGGGIGDPRSLVDLTGRDVDIDIDLRAGSARATIRTNDLSMAYVRAASAYTS
ncbi:bifunctional glutamate N-acetyltransferase/amino-acid acetyltransferase ArgJ [Blastococcus sp. SYSU D01042]